MTDKFPQMPLYAKGDRVMKVTGYSYFGEVVSAFYTTSGELRYVVENTGENAGMLFIFNQKQLGKDTREILPITVRGH